MPVVASAEVLAEMVQNRASQNSFGSSDEDEEFHVSTQSVQLTDIPYSTLVSKSADSTNPQHKHNELYVCVEKKKKWNMTTDTEYRCHIMCISSRTWIFPCFSSLCVSIHTVRFSPCEIYSLALEAHHRSLAPYLLAMASWTTSLTPNRKRCAVTLTCVMCSAFAHLWSSSHYMNNAKKFSLIEACLKIKVNKNTVFFFAGSQCIPCNGQSVRNTWAGRSFGNVCNSVFACILGGLLK